MKNLLLLAVFIIFGGTALAQSVKNFTEQSIVVKLKPEQNDRNLSTAQKFEINELKRLKVQFPYENIQLTGNRNIQDSYVIYFEDGDDVQVLVDRFQQTGLFEYVEPNYNGIGGGECFETLNTTPDDPLFPRQWGLKNDGNFPLAPSEAGADIKMEAAWDIEQGDASTVIAVLDSGVKLDHPEIANRLWKNTNETIDGVDNDGNGFIDDVDGWNFAYANNNPSDDVGHGTNIIGILASNANNAIAYAGINWNCKIMPVKMLNSNNSYPTVVWAVDAIYYAVDNGADVINMSFGGSGNSSLLADALTYAANNGVVMTASMMNFDNSTLYYPAANPETIAVGSIDPDGDRSSPFFWSSTSGSNFGPHIDLIAPGNYLYSITHTSDTNYNIYWGGTSQAAPHVAGIASLLLAQDPLLSPEDIRMILRTTADDQTGDPLEDISGFDIYYGYGRLNAFEALSTVLDVEDISEATGFTLYPNPVSSTSEIVILDKEQSIRSVKIYNLLGEQLLSQQISNVTSRVHLSMSNFATGVYIVEAFNNIESSLGKVRVIVY